MEILECQYCPSRSTEEDKTNLVPLSEVDFRQLYLYEPPEEKAYVDKMKEHMKWDKRCATKILPILSWLPSYKKSDLLNDALAGLTVGVMHIPQGMAYALLGGVPPVIGIYMAFFPVLVYIFMGTSQHVSMGTFAVVCMMVGTSVDQFSGVGRSSNSTEVAGLKPEVPQEDALPAPLTSVQVATALCLVVGIWQVLLSLFRLGSLSVFLSPTLVSGFTTGAAVHVLTSQIRNLLGINVSRYSGPLKIIYSYVDIFTNLPELNVAATILSMTFICTLVIFNELIKPLVQKKLKKAFPFPIELAVVIAGTLISQFLDLKTNYGVAILETVPKGLPNFEIPPLRLLPDLFSHGLIVAVVAVSINISMASIFAEKMGYEIDGNQEILASGVGNIFSSFFSCMPFAASLSRSLVQVSVGGKTQVTSAVSALFLLFILLFVGPYFEPLPYSVLSTIIVVALKGMFTQMRDVPDIFRKSKLDGFVWAVTFLSVVILDISYGLGIGLMGSITCLIMQSRGYKIAVLGRVPKRKTYEDISLYKRAQLISNVLIIRVVGSLHFANSGSVRKKLLKEFIKYERTVRRVAPSLVDDLKKRDEMSVVLDLGGVPFVDPSAVKALKSVRDTLSESKCHFLMAACHPSVYATLEKSNFFGDSLKWMVYHNLDDAVHRAKNLLRQVQEYGDLIIKY